MLVEPFEYVKLQGAVPVRAILMLLVVGLQMVAVPDTVAVGSGFTVAVMGVRGVFSQPEVWSYLVM